MHTSSDHTSLNAQQKEAVEFGEGPLLIIAGAGTGKTTVITERIKHLIASGKALPSQILALTFTEKAAREMEARVDAIMPYGYTQLWISTFHKFCDRLLRAEAIHIGIDPSYKLMTESDATLLFKRNLFSFPLDYFRPLGNPTKFIAGMLQHISRLSDEDISVDAYQAWSFALPETTDEERQEKQKYLELSSLYRAYQELKQKEGRYDFGDLITTTLHLFRKRKNILSYYQRQFRYILVDEFQDTNIAQNELISLLAGEDKNITAVCDDDQSIYKFRGAAVSNVLSFRKHYPKAKVIVLTKNYRSTQQILDASYALIQYNNPDRLEVSEQINKKLIAKEAGKGRDPEFLYYARVEQEADGVTAKIIELHQQYGWKDIAILLRANNHADPFVRAFERKGIPYQFLGPGKLFSKSEILDLVAYLKVLLHYDNAVALFRVLSMEHFSLDAKELASLSNYAKRQNVSLFDACEEKGSESVQKIIAMIKRHLTLLSKESAGQILFYFLEDSGLLKDILSYSTKHDEQRAMNISKFFSKLKTYEADHVDVSVSGVLDWIEMSMETGESPLASDTDWTENDAVNILTVHGSKGLEFPVVFLVNLVSQRFPTSERREQIPIPEALIKEELPQGDYHLEEERRLFYVGLTRAKERLYLTAANYYGEGKREKKISVFVEETLGEKARLVKPQEGSGQLPLLEWKKTVGSDTRPVEWPKISYVSYSQIEAFRLCPLHYKLRYLLHIAPPVSAALSFGTSVHAALYEFYRLHSLGSGVSKEQLLSLLDTYWRHEGYESKAYEEKMKQRGIRYISDYFDGEYRSDTKVLALEQPFLFPVEHIKVGGKIDRVDLLSDGRIEIIDYKTGKMPGKRDIDTNLQLSLYAMAISSMKDVPFSRKPEDILLSLYYFESKTKISTTRTAQQLEQEKQVILSTVGDIEASDFRCSKHQLCTSCEYADFCVSSIG